MALSTASTFGTDCVLMLHGDGTDASTTFTDSSISVHTPTVNGNVQIDTAQSKFGGASILFDGNGDYLTYASDTNFGFETRDFTFDFWVRFNTTGGTQQMIGTGAGGTGVEIFLNSGTLFFRINGGATDVTYSWSPNANQWYHVAATRSGTSMKLFVDGTQQGSGTNSSNTGSSNTLDIGRLGGGTRYLDGWLDEIRVVKENAVWTASFTPPTAAYNFIALTLSTGTTFGTDCVLLAHMNGTDASTSFIDSSTRVHTLTASGNAQIDTAQFQFGGASGLFDGTGDYVTSEKSVDFELGTGMFTIDFWVRFNVVGAVNRPIFDIGNGNGSNGIAVFVDTNANLLRLYMNATPSNFSWTPTTGVWYHVAFTRDSSFDVRAFINGTQIGSTSNRTENINGAPTTVKIGTDEAQDGFLNGWFDEVRIVKGTAVWTANFTPSGAEYSQFATRTYQFFNFF